MALGIGKKSAERLNLSMATISRIADLAPAGYNEWQSDRDAIQKYFPGTDDWLMQCHYMPTQHEIIMEMFNEALQGFGVESIEGEYVDRYYQNFVAEYVNMGDTYDTTVLRDNRTGRYIVTSFGDFVETNNL